MKRKTAKRVLAFAVCIIFIMVAFLSAAVVLTHTQHEHDHDGPGGNCATCAHAAVAGNLLKLLAGALVCAAFGVGPFAAIRSTIKVPCFHAALSTLVHQKVKLNS